MSEISGASYPRQDETTFSRALSTVYIPPESDSHGCDYEVDPIPGRDPEVWTCPACGRRWELKVTAHYEPEDT